MSKINIEEIGISLLAFGIGGYVKVDLMGVPLGLAALVIGAIIVVWGRK